MCQNRLAVKIGQYAGTHRLIALVIPFMLDDGGGVASVERGYFSHCELVENGLGAKRS